jgi:HK97 family phage portal protein
LCKRLDLRLFGFNISIEAPWDQARHAASRNINTLPYGSGPSGWGTLYDSIFSGSGVVTRQKALQVPAVFAAVDVVSRTLASLPFAPFRRTPEGAEHAVGHPLWAMETIEPSPHTTSYNFRRDMFADACFGNAYAKISFKGNGRAYKLERLIPEDVVIYQREDGTLYYAVSRKMGTQATFEILYPWEVIHLRGMTIDGWQGINISNQFNSSFATSIDATRYGHNFFSNNAAIDGIVAFPQGLSKDARDIIEDRIQKKHAGVKNVGGIMVLDAGASYTKIGTNPQEAMLNETRMFQAYESCRIFGVPAHMINVLDRSTFNNIEMMDNGFVKYCLTPWAEQFEAECDVKLLTQDEKINGTIFHRFDMTNLMRGDMKSRAEYEDKMLKNMVLTINDVRRMNNMNEVPWGNLPFAQAGVTRVNEEGEIELPEPPEVEEKEPKGTKEIDNEQEPGTTADE